MDQVVSIPLKCSCPNDCDCSNPGRPKSWCHSHCKKQSRINAVGDIYCPDYKINKECEPYFIKDASFKCADTKTWKQFRRATQFLMAVAQALQAADFQLNDDEMVKFSTTLNQAVIEKWNK